MRNLACFPGSVGEILMLSSRRARKKKTAKRIKNGKRLTIYPNTIEAPCPACPLRCA